jgi:DNA polymerase I-like protein with 3'-5' exonuclease and polymerase domains|tara:strand:- start:84 stop:1955 length:1872 start_codon:yes stop_codon:yes gene_type:complete
MGDKIMQKPLFTTPTEWVQPSSFPDLSKYDEIAIDLETKDPELKKMGPGMFREVGNIVGFAVAVENWSGYFPIRHEGGGNMDIRMVLNWIKEVLNTPATKIFHNAMYDVCWLKSEGLNINGKIVDTMIATSLIDENRMRYDLNSVAKQYTGLSKNESSLTEAAQAWGIDPKAEMYKLPAMYVGEYAEKDAEITLALWQELKKEINHQDLNSIFDLETNLFPCLVEMKAKGVRVDLDHAKTVEKNLIKTENNMLQSIKDEVGFIPDLWAARSIAKVFDHLKLDYPRTEKTKAPSFTKNFLKNHNNFIINLINNARQANKARTTFMESIFRYVHKGRIHADINQLRSEFGGTITGRFSMTHPNLQQIPKSGTDMGNQLRTIFVPEEGHTWGCFDYSQQEPRLVVHYACLTELPGSEEFKEKYKNDFSTDFHKIVSEMADIPRDQAKTINLGKFYGMGKNKLKGELGVPDEEASRIIRQYDSRVPFVKQLMNHASDRAERRGQIRTLLGRLCHFHLWEPSQFGVHKPLSHEAALQEHGPGIKRAFTYKALNKLIQGSAADMIKKAMLDLYKEKIIPLIQIHDELNISIKDKAESDKVIEIMENAVSLEVPNKVDYEKGKHWGEIEG